MQTQPRITVAICTYNRAEYLRDTLQGLSNQSVEPQLFEILVVNNNSTDHTEQVCKEFQKGKEKPTFKHVIEPEQGLSRARNRAAKESRAPIVIFIDDDVYLPKEFIQEALTYSQSYSTSFCAGGRIDVAFEGESRQPSWIPNELMPMFGLHNPFEEEREYTESNFPRGGNMVIHKSVFEKAGYFKTDLGRTGGQLLGGEEKDYFDTVRRKGIPLYYWPKLRLTHRIGRARLEKEYIKNQSVGIGHSEWLRVRHNPADIVRKSAEEAVKFAGSLILFFWYGLSGRWRAAMFLIQFRIWVLVGFLGSKTGAQRNGVE
jgi:glycosyltransferase involved in cell wall biosynthesis